MPKKKQGNLIGSWSFLIGVILAVVFGFMGPLSQGVVYILFGLGIIIGLLNIGDEEAMSFLTAGTILVIVSALGQAVVATVPLFDRILSALAMLFVPATIIVALKYVFSIARR